MFSSIRSWINAHGITVSLWLALGAALGASLNHLAWSFSTMSTRTTPGLWDWGQAIAIDIGLFALTFGIQQRKRSDQPTALLWAGMFIFAGISTFANLLYGFEHRQALANVPNWMNAARPWIMSAVLPMLVVFLTEVNSENVQQRQTVTAGGDNPPADGPPSGPKNTSDTHGHTFRLSQALAAVNAAKAATRSERVEVVKAWLLTHGADTHDSSHAIAAFAAHFDVTERTARRYYNDARSALSDSVVTAANGNHSPKEADNA